MAPKRMRPSYMLAKLMVCLAALPMPETLGVKAAGVATIIESEGWDAISAMKELVERGYMRTEARGPGRGLWVVLTAKGMALGRQPLSAARSTGAPRRMA